MIPPELEKMFEQLSNAYKKEGGGVFGLAGVSRLDYFAAHAPPAPDAWIADRCREGGATGASARVAWAWEYGRQMIHQKPALEAPAPEGMYVVVSAGMGSVYARASTPAKAKAALERVAQKEMTNATSFKVEGPYECPTCGHGSPHCGTKVFTDALTPPK